MRAVVQDRYGPPAKVLRVAEVEAPRPGDGEVLVGQRASAVHPDVWHAVTGRPWAGRMMASGLLAPAHRIPGIDVAGVVEAAGPGATRFAPGDEVFGLALQELSWRNGGAFAERVVAPAASLARKPANVGFAAAASVPTSGYIALLNLRGGALVPPGASVLVNGAGGGVGSLAVQLAKSYGARVTGVDRTDRLEMVSELGADRVVDFTREDVTRRPERYDLVFDVASTLTLAAARRLLTERGVYVLIGHDHFGRARGRVLGSIPRVLALLARARRDPHLSGPGPVALAIGEAMATLAELLAAGTLTPVIDRVFPLAEAAAALAYLEEDRARGRVALTP